MLDSGVRFYAAAGLFVGVFVCTLLALFMFSLAKISPKQGVDPACNGPSAHAYACSFQAKTSNAVR